MSKLSILFAFLILFSFSIFTPTMAQTMHCGQPETVLQKMKTLDFTPVWSGKINDESVVFLVVNSKKQWILTFSIKKDNESLLCYLMEGEDSHLVNE